MFTDKITKDCEGISIFLFQRPCGSDWWKKMRWHQWTSAEPPGTHRAAPTWWEEKRENVIGGLCHIRCLPLYSGASDPAWIWFKGGKADGRVCVVIPVQQTGSDQLHSQSSFAGSLQTSNTAVWFTLCRKFRCLQNAATAKAERRRCVQKQKTETCPCFRWELVAVGRGFSFNCI